MVLRKNKIPKNLKEIYDQTLLKHSSTKDVCRTNHRDPVETVELYELVRGLTHQNYKTYCLNCPFVYFINHFKLGWLFSSVWKCSDCTIKRKLCTETARPLD